MKTLKETDNKIISYLTFRLGNETFAANVSKVVNILEMVKITKVPKTPVYMKGIINLRGAVLPIIDTRIKFDMEETPVTNSTCILVLEIKKSKEIIQVGALVDAVDEVVEIEDEEILDPPAVNKDYSNAFISGMAHKGEGFIMILDMDYIFSSEEIKEIKEKTEKNASIAENVKQ